MYKTFKSCENTLHIFPYMAKYYCAQSPSYKFTSLLKMHGPLQMFFLDFYSYQILISTVLVTPAMHV